MAPFTQILVDIDATAGRHPALDLAVALARRWSARLTVVDVVPGAPLPARAFLPPGIEEELATHRGEHLVALAGELRSGGVDLRLDVLRGKPAVALVREVLRGGHDLLIRSHGRTSDDARPFGAVDMELLRLCPCPVWLVPSGAPPVPRRVLATVHANPDDEREQRLNRRIVEVALDVAGLEGGPLTLLQAWIAYGEELLRHRMPETEWTAYVDEARNDAEGRLETFAASFGTRLAGTRVETVCGEADDVIATYAGRHSIDLVVMGSVARTGLPGILIGNTAERILQRLRSSVLAVKPDEFVSPVSLD